MKKSNKGKIRQDIKASSSVIAPLLMVAMTIVIAAVIYDYTGNMGSCNKNTPIAYLSAKETCEGNLTLCHDGGEDLDWNNLKILIVENEENFPDDLVGSPQQNPRKEENNENPSGSETDMFTAGEEKVIKDNTISDTLYSIKVIWIPTNVILLEKIIRV